MSILNSIDSFFKENKTCIENLSNFSSLVEEITTQLILARDNEKTIFTFGNGGSASTASHFTSDLLKTAIILESKRFKSISLVDNIPVNSAWSNDKSFDFIFSEQLKNFTTRGDIIIGFSGSGNSENILNAMKLGKELGATCIGLTGMTGGHLPQLTDYFLGVPSNDMLIIESMHLLICHSIINAIRTQGTPEFKYE